MLDSLLPEAHIAMGWVNSHMEWDWINADKEFQRALELSPGNAIAHVAYATFLLLLNRNDEAIAEMETAIVLDPVSPFVNQTFGWAYFISGRPEEAIAQFHKTIELDPLHIWARTQLAWTYAFKGMFNEAAAQSDTVIKVLNPEFDPWLYSSLASIYAMAGNQEPAEETIALLKEVSKESFIDPFNFACLYANLNETELALEWLEKAIDARSLNVLELLKPAENKLFLRNICEEPRYTELVIISNKQQMKRLSVTWKTDASGQLEYLYPSYNHGNIRKFGVYPKPSSDGDTYTGTSIIQWEELR